MTAKIILGSRGSLLALAQTREVSNRLMAAWPELREEGAIEIRRVKTTGDIVSDRPLVELGGKGMFIKELESKLLSREIDAAVHSIKDIETTIAESTVLEAVLPRSDPRDAFISYCVDSFNNLPDGARVGTASVRRAALVRSQRPDLQIVLFRGNLDTRLRKLREGQAEATFLAVCGLQRLKMEHTITKIMEVNEFPPAVSQGAIGVQRRAGSTATHDANIARWLSALDDWASRSRVIAERSMLATLQGSCRTPISGHAVLNGNLLTLSGLVLSLDGMHSHSVTASAVASEAESLGRWVGEDILSRCGRNFLA
ncbi:porphobilinogen deaminase [Candidatus Endolissoclinum faulkneri L2]|uniref:Porphobilinogen deaminase n=1 Tax=Candidatus Endolissoclinum faulkneri L2 TaxID=1193729 RepID=K7Z506_9PROT|nr:hydroxymethylbilane synthase [Candidatus Endolissoclinum faulkneri]AFX99133.1 porphobilinogen deaminase [Candidatus Endolissoclinum faulkneri L2]